MDMLQNLPGGEQGRQLQDFVNRYSTGDPKEGYTPDEARQNYETVAQNLPPDQFQASAADAFAKLSPADRQAFAEDLRQRASQQGVNTPTLSSANPSQLQDPQQLARAATEVHQQQPNLLGQLLGNGGTSSNPIAKAAVAGIAAMAAQRLLGQHR